VALALWKPPWGDVVKATPTKMQGQFNVVARDALGLHKTPATFFRKNLEKDLWMTRLLLTGVVKPYGVDDEYGEALCTMELLNNQVTREQGIHSPRSNNLSFALYLLAENINVPTTVLDFPSWKDFTHEIDRGKYSHVGISFIIPNVLKARRMARYIRARSPKTKIIVGGHGTAIPDLKTLIDCDEICRGEGVSWLRRYFGENPSRPIVHPAIPTSVNSHIYGAPILEKAGIIIPGVGCENSCRFCATSHKFDKKYTAFLKSGRDIFEACQQAEQALYVTDFGLMDENFCKHPQRASELLAELESESKAYTFATFSSAETVKAVGVDFLVRLGVNFLWVGAESKANLFEKTRGIDLKSMIANLQNHGITVLASAILFLEHHDKKTIEEDIDWAIGLESDLLQFMQFGPVPGTRLYKDYLEAGTLLQDFPWQRQHGQDVIWFEHPHFTAEETHNYLKQAFVKKYHAHGAGVLNMAWTALKGYRTVKQEVEWRERNGFAWDPKSFNYVQLQTPQPDPFMHLRLKSIKRNTLKFRPALNAMVRYAPNARAVEKGKMIINEFNRTFGPLTVQERILEQVVRVSAFVENRRLSKTGLVMRQPPLIRKIYRRRAEGVRPSLGCETQESAA
jgi:hypothetical protein